MSGEMSFSLDENPNNHPEVNASETQPVNEKTKTELLELIKQRAMVKGPTSDGIYGIGLSVPNEDRTVLNAYWYPEESRRQDDLGLLRAKCVVNRMSQDYNIHNVTFYKFIDTPDGIEIAKFLQNHDMSDLGDMDEDSETDFEVELEKINDLRKQIDLAEKAGREEFEMGLSFVGQKEAQKLLELLKISYPSNPKWR